MTTEHRSIVSLSGGMDSSTVLAMAVEQHAIYGGRVALAVGFTYGSKHNQYENAAAKALADHYKVPFKLLDLTDVFTNMTSNLLKSGGDIPEGHYEAESMKLTVVPGRNIVFISILSGIAWSLGAQEVWIGVHAGDHAIYPDCRPDFFGYMENAILEGTDQQVGLVAPFLHGNKETILKKGFELRVPYELTRTCYKDQPIACGKCGSCQERLAAFQAMGVVDPIPYEQT